MTLHDRFIAAAKLLGGDTDRWQAAAGAKLGISRGHMHHLVTGVRPVTQQMIVKTIAAARDEASVLRARAESLDAIFADLTMAELATAPTKISKEEYQRQAEEAESIINEMASPKGPE